MSRILSNLFGSYNLYAKALPGTIFLLGCISLLPTTGDGIDLQLSGAIVAGLIALIVTIGFVFGQVLHSLAVRVEKLFYYIFSTYYKIYTIANQLLKSKFSNKSPVDDGDEDGDDIKSKYDMSLLFFFATTTPFVAYILYLISVQRYTTAIIYIAAFLMPSFSLLRQIKNWFKYVFTPHRRIFDEFLLREAASGDYEDLVSSFHQVADNQFEWISIDSNDDLYVSVSSYLKFSEYGRSRIFQATYSFCRGMWVTSLSFSSLYLIIYNPETAVALLPIPNYDVFINILSYDPLIYNLIGNGHGMLLAGVVMFFCAIVFMDGERQYKKLYVKYMIVDFLVLHGSDFDSPERI